MTSRQLADHRKPQIHWAQEHRASGSLLPQQPERAFRPAARGGEGTFHPQVGQATRSKPASSHSGVEKKD
jgi:hypothetical protein